MRNSCRMDQGKPLAGGSANSRGADTFPCFRMGGPQNADQWYLAGFTRSREFAGSALAGGAASSCLGVIFLLLAFLFPRSLPAQQSTSGGSPSEVQNLGRRIFQQRCGVCHTAPAINSGVYGPVLYKDLIIGNEDSTRQFILNGSRRMPGFKYGLEPSQVEAVIAYLKTVPKPSKSGSSESKDRGPID